jgi:hypothetical protein
MSKMKKVVITEFGDESKLAIVEGDLPEPAAGALPRDSSGCGPQRLWYRRPPTTRTAPTFQPPIYLPHSDRNILRILVRHTFLLIITTRQEKETINYMAGQSRRLAESTLYFAGLPNHCFHVL